MGDAGHDVGRLSVASAGGAAARRAEWRPLSRPSAPARDTGAEPASLVYSLSLARGENARASCRLESLCVARKQVLPTEMADQAATNETAAAPAATGTAKKAKSAASAKKPRAKPAHPRTSEMVTAAIKSLKERGGSSLQAIKKYIAAHYKLDAEKLAPFIKKYLKSAVVAGELVQTKGKGASGSFKLAGGGAAGGAAEGGKARAGAAKKKRAAPASKEKKGARAAGAKKAGGVKAATGRKAGAAKKAAGAAAAPAGAKKAAAAKPAKAKSPSKAKKAAKVPTKKPKAPRPKKATTPSKAKASPKKKK